MQIPPPNTGILFGQVQVNSEPVPANEVVQIPVKFSSPFPTTPTVVVTPASVESADYKDTFASTVVGVTPYAFLVNVYRVDSSGWGQTLYLNWLAISSS